MNTFIFQSLPQRYDLREKLIPGEKDTWYATRYRNKMKPGDLVYFWMGGDDMFHGLYGWGEITSAPYIREEWDSYGVDIVYRSKFEKPITKSKILKYSNLSNLLLFRAPQASNFLVEPSEAKSMIRLIEKFGEESPKNL
ncbi:EVE domain-containing protein [Persicobacter diffluens]|uniref:EVE domain-containing protein n=1 Tax=Persicobacter diffluens TaxID=981 RepID=A0AAN5AQ24_9BACT|nr:hypothetical protein PEDI_54230 [Persicobacter diffluens]